MEFDKATYAPGEKGFVKIWAVDSTGKAVGPQTLTNLVSSSGISRTGSFSGTEPTWTATSYAVAAQSPLLGNSLSSTTPIAVLTVYMPYSGGPISVSATGGSLLPASGQVKVTATASVTDSASAALAAVTALATTVASLKTLITTLTNLVLKIQKKVKA
jgi:enamine deaminase RidA (YjgF/YER057c/UK114 family)